MCLVCARLTCCVLILYRAVFIDAFVTQDSVMDHPISSVFITFVAQPHGTSWSVFILLDTNIVYVLGVRPAGHGKGRQEEGAPLQCSPTGHTSTQSACTRMRPIVLSVGPSRFLGNRRHRRRI